MKREINVNLGLAAAGKIGPDNISCIWNKGDWVPEERNPSQECENKGWRAMCNCKSHDVVKNDAEEEADRGQQFIKFGRFLQHL